MSFQNIHQFTITFFIFLLICVNIVISKHSVPQYDLSESEMRMVLNGMSINDLNALNNLIELNSELNYEYESHEESPTEVNEEEISNGHSDMDYTDEFQYDQIPYPKNTISLKISTGEKEDYRLNYNEYYIRQLHGSFPRNSEAHSKHIRIKRN
ncbi:uncharacterized protein LOC142226891 isoform X1 [Haematobia irritans]|uniref:uncharacterized protein LOC142226891 isoform X1 n=1 Tax=Haematobia irritans TaxID=7368 RepID=UPI003F5098B2